MQRDPPRLGKEELFERLGGAAAAGITVLTPNRRMAQALHRDFDRRQRALGLASWETPDILPFDAFVRRLWEDARHAEAGERLPILLAPHQELALWQDAIAASRAPASAFSVHAAAAQCVSAWRLAHAWRIVPGPRIPLAEDARAFVDWSGRYERAARGRNRIDAARLPDSLAALLADPALRKPAIAVAYGFDLVSPQMRSCLEALAACGCTILEGGPGARAAKVARLAFTDAKEEIAAAARWARARLEADPHARIGVVVPDLARLRATVERTFASVLRPASLLGRDASAAPFTLSLGPALSDRPLVHDALALLELAGPGTRFAQASRLVRSSFVTGAASEMAPRAALDAWLRGRCAPEIHLDALLRLVRSPKAPRAPALAARLERLAEFRKSSLFGAKGAAEWARAFSIALARAGFPGERTLDSRDYQALAKWHEVLAGFAALESVTAVMGYTEARERLERMARDTIFQPQSGDVPVQVMGVLESAGIDFDCLWVTGLTDEAWPLPARPDPFLPIALQRSAGIPQADPAASIALDRRITEGWMGAAGEVVLSHFRMQGESELVPSPLIASLPEASLADLGVPAYATARDAIRRSGAMETVTDASGPATGAAARPGGTSLFRDQAACPFRAFARFRLLSEPLETPRHGLDARDRGTLVHCMLASAWKALGSHARLAATPPAELDKILATSADEAIAAVRRYRADALGGRFGELERERLVRLAREWLALEARREPFTVTAVEEKRPMTFGGVTVNVKLDRLDRLEAGGDAILDYKTGACATGAWMGERPQEPQLPMYALGGGADVAAVAFAQVKAGEMGFKGIGRSADLLPGVKLVSKDRSPAAKRYRDWDALVAGWSAELEAIGRGFAGGDARVDPRDGAETCAMCQQQMVCRVAEKAPFGGVGAGVPDE